MSHRRIPLTHKGPVTRKMFPLDDAIMYIHLLYWQIKTHHWYAENIFLHAHTYARTCSHETMRPVLSRTCMVCLQRKQLWASYQIPKIAGCTCAGNAGNLFPATDLLAIPACITTRASCTCRDTCQVANPWVAGKTFSAFPAHVQPAILRIWQETHGRGA